VKVPQGDRKGFVKGFVKRVRRPDRYGLLLLLVLCSILSLAASVQMSATARGGGLGAVIALLFAGGTLLFALHTSRAPRWLSLVAVIVLSVAIVAGPVVHAFSIRGGRILVTTCESLLVLATITAIVRRMGTHFRISGQTILAAICIYLMIGLLFASSFSAIDAATGQFFADPTAHSAADFLYFSYATMTTVGYGDLIARGDVARLFAITDALCGQVYLVTVVALIVGNFGRERDPTRMRFREDLDEADDLGDPGGPG